MGQDFSFRMEEIFTIEVLNLEMGKRVFQLSPTCAYLIKTTLKKIVHP